MRDLDSDSPSKAPAEPDGRPAIGSTTKAVPQFLASLDATRTVVAVSALGVLARLIELGARVQHFDEARVGWWTLRFMRTGTFEYRYIIHGPFLQHVNTWVFSLIGATDFASRLVVALVGGLLPLVTLLFRGHLRSTEVIAAALFLALNPVLLYYSRFSRSTMLVAAFMTVAFGFLVRWHDTRRPLYAHFAVAFAALGVTAKENAVVYLACWVGAGVLTLALFGFARPGGRTGLDRMRSLLGNWIDAPPTGDRIGRAAAHAVVATALFTAIITFFYAPRTGSGGIGLYRALAAPGQFPELVSTMVGQLQEGYTYWFGRTTDPGCRKETVVAGYACFLGRSLLVLANYAAPLVGLAIVGTFVEHFGAARPRALVMITSYWGFVSVVGYPLGADVFGAWIMVNALVPLTVPAGVGVALVYRAGREALAASDALRSGLLGLLLVGVVGQMAIAGVQSSYLHPTADSNELVQFAQPQQELRRTLEDMQERAHDNAKGPDVLVYGSAYVDGDRSVPRRPGCVKWFNALPLPWYWETAGVSVDCARNVTGLRTDIRAPVVLAKNSAATRAALTPRLGADYEARTHHLRTIGDEIVVYVRDP